MTIVRGSLALVISVAAFMGVGCGTASDAGPSEDTEPAVVEAELTLDSTCAEYLETPRDERHDKAMILSVEAGADDGGNPLWGPNTDYQCSRNSGRVLRNVFGG